MFEVTAEAAAWVTGVTAGLAVLAGGARWLGKRVVLIVRKVDGAVDALVGRPALVHPDTGAVLVEATPGLGPRLATIEAALVELTHTQRAIADLGVRVDDVSARLDRHLEESCP